MKKFAVLSMLALCAIVAGSAAVLAADAAPAGVAVTVTGKNYNLLSTLAKDQAEGADAALAGLNGLQVSSVKGADGKAVEGFKGKTLHYLPTKGAADLISGAKNKDKTVTVTGKLFADANTLLVEKFTAAAADEWDDVPVKTISKKQQL